MRKYEQFVQKEFDGFFEFPTDDKSVVSSTSCCLFAEHMMEKLVSIVLFELQCITSELEK